MIRIRRLVLLAAALLALGGAVTTGAFTGGDEAVRGVYLDPADTPNGQQYAEIGSDGEFRLNVSNLNPHSTSVVDDVFVIGTDHDEARVWIEDDEPRVDFYRMDGRESVESSSDPVVVTDDDPVLVGLEVTSGNKGVVMESITLHATIPDQQREGGTGGGGDGSEGSTPTETDTPTDTETPTPDDTATDTDTPTPDDGGPSDGGAPSGGDGSSDGGAPPDGGEATQTETATPDDGEPSDGEAPSDGSEDSDTPTPTDTATPDVGTPADGGTTTATDTPTPTETRTVAGGGAPGTALRVVNVTVTPESPGVGEEITVTVVVANTGSETGTRTVEIRVGGEVIATETVTLEPGERRTISGTVSFDRPGAYEVAVLDETRTITVAEADGSPLEVGSLGSALLGLLLVLGAALALFAFWRRGEPDFVVTTDEDSWSSFELEAVAGAATVVTDDEGRTRLAFDVGRDGGTLDPAFSVRNVVAEAAGLRVVAVDAEGNAVTDGVRVEATDGADLTAFPTAADAPGVLDEGEEIAVRVVFADADAVEAVATLRVERGPAEFD